VIGSSAVGPELSRSRHRLRIHVAPHFLPLPLSDYWHPIARRPLHSAAAPPTVAPNNSFKPKTNRYAIVFGLTQALGPGTEHLSICCCAAERSSQKPTPSSFLSYAPPSAVAHGCIHAKLACSRHPLRAWFGLALISLNAICGGEPRFQARSYVHRQSLGGSLHWYKAACCRCKVLARGSSVHWPGPNSSFKPKPLRGSA